jgi:hypothetical protein
MAVELPHFQPTRIVRTGSRDVDSSCPASLSKIFSFSPDPNHPHIRSRPVPLEGRLAIVTDAGRDAVDVDGALTRALDLRTAKTCGPDASTLAPSLADNFRKATEARKPDLRGERGISRKPLRAGMPGDSGELVVNTRVHFLHPMRTRGCGCTGHPAFPTPSLGGIFFALLGRNAPRECGSVSRRHCEQPTGRANARPMTGSATKQSTLFLCGTMDCFAEPVIVRRIRADPVARNDGR